ncbi:carbohydrate ABC transporter permease [Paenibacillus sp. strain BS8-2]
MHAGLEASRTSQPSSAPKIRKERLNFNNFYGYLILTLPSIFFFGLFFALPVFASFLFSFTNFNGLNLNLEFVGLNNFKLLLSDPSFYHGIKNSFIFALVVVIIQNILGLLAALGLNQSSKGSNLMRTLIFAPCLISAVVVAFIWTYIYDINGTINFLLTSVGLEKWAMPWLGMTNTALLAVIIAHSWRFIGRTAIIYIANLKSIPNDIIEASIIDGASPFKRFVHVIFPLLAPATTINLTTSFMGSLNTFDIFFAMTEGGPGHATETMGTFVIRQMFNNLNGYASAASVINIIVILITGAVLFKWLTGREEKAW